MIHSTAHPDHVLAVYRTDAFLTTSLADFLVAGLESGRGAAVVTSPRGWAATRRVLERHGVDVARDLDTGRIVFLDAAVTLEAILADGPPTRAALERQVGPAVARIRAATGRDDIVAYGDMVNVLWLEGEVETAQQLEWAWHEWIDTEPIELLCAYQADPLDSMRGRPALLSLCSAHGRVIAAEDGARRAAALRRAVAQVPDIDLPLDRVPAGEAAEELALVGLRAIDPVAAERIAARTRGILVQDVVSVLKELHDPALLLAGVLANAPVGFQVYDRDGRSVFVNETFLRMFGVAPPPEYCIFEDPIAERNGHTELIRRVFAGESAEIGPMWYDPDELGLDLANARAAAISVTMWPLFDATGAVSRVVVFHRDVTAELRAREALEARERRFRAIVENGGDVVSIRDVSNRISWMSPASLKVLGRPPEWFHERDARELVHPDDQEVADAAVAEILANPDRAAKATYRVRRADGCWRWLAATFTNGSSDPEIGGLIVNEHDVTEQVEAEDRLRGAHKMEALGRLAGGIAHDFNNLLSIVAGFGHLAMGRTQRGHDVTPELRNMLDAADRASSLTKQLLAFGRRGVRNPQTMDIGALLTGMLPLIERAAGPDVQVELRLSPTPALVRADKGQVEQVVMNLTVNAREAMPAGGRLELELQVQVQEVVLRVEDTGVGIPEEVLPQLFEPFFTTKPSGHGLGLASVFGIVNDSGGTIQVSSSPGHTVFEVALPRAEGAAHALPSPPALPVIAGDETILVAEDEPAVREYVARVLSEAGYLVHVARDAEEALRVAASVEGRLHALVTDVVMPGASGRQLARALRERRPDLRVLFVSGFAEQSELATELPGGARFLQKPVLPGDLLVTLRELLDGAISRSASVPTA